jgi:hypothetical protein
VEVTVTVEVDAVLVTSGGAEDPEKVNWVVPEEAVPVTDAVTV